ncbi:MAG TPA: hypothetical protein VJT31_21790, partial [Rugosimonospora sp.]|nr:hypothetical protein [Rugosimonospora sp.]
MRPTTYLRTALRTVSRQILFPALGLGAGLTGAVLVTAQMPHTYEASTSVLINVHIESGKTTDSIRAQAPSLNLVIAQNLLSTVARLAQSREVATDVAKTLALKPADVYGRLSATYEPGMQIITVTATATSAALAAALANAGTAALGHQVAQVDVGAMVTTRTLDTAIPPAGPVSPRPLPNAALGAIIGLLAGIGFRTLGDRFDDRLRGLVTLGMQLGLPVLGIFPRLSRRLIRTGARRAAGQPEIGEAICATVASLAVLASAQRRRRILVTSPGGNDREGFVAQLLALGLALNHDRVTVVDGQIGRPGTRFAPAPGTIPPTGRGAGQDVDTARRDGSGVITRVTADELRQLADGAPMDAARLGVIVDTLADSNDVVVVHAPPALSGADLVTLARHADAVLLVVQTGITRTMEAKRAALLVERLGLQLAGLVVINTSEDLARWPQPDAWPPVATPRGPVYDPFFAVAPYPALAYPAGAIGSTAYAAGAIEAPAPATIAAQPNAPMIEAQPPAPAQAAPADAIP